MASTLTCWFSLLVLLQFVLMHDLCRGCLLPGRGDLKWCPLDSLCFFSAPPFPPAPAFLNLHKGLERFSWWFSLPFWDSLTHTASSAMLDHASNFLTHHNVCSQKVYFLLSPLEHVSWKYLLKTHALTCLESFQISSIPPNFTTLPQPVWNHPLFPPIFLKPCWGIKCNHWSGP